MKILKIFTGIAFLMAIILGIFIRQPVRANAQTAWLAPMVISKDPGYSWFPDIAVDENDVPHVIWCQTTPNQAGDGLDEQVSYGRQWGRDWTVPNDILPTSRDIARSAIAADQAGGLHMIFGGSQFNGNFVLRYVRSDLNNGWSAKAWTASRRINRGISYAGDIAVDTKGIIHVVYDDTIIRAQSGNQQVTRTYADAYYRQSTNDGLTWESPISLFPESETGSSRVQLELDRRDGLHVTWDEGWDRLTGTSSTSFHGIYTQSTDGGKTWSQPKVVDYPDNTVAQITPASDGDGGVLLVWRTMISTGVYYQWSTDGGQNWQAAGAIPGIYARPWTNPFDSYDMTTDSAGNIHLIMVGSEIENSEQLGVYELIWDGEQWAQPIEIFTAPGWYPEYPKILAHDGNQLHAVWFTREGSVWEQNTRRSVWYTRRLADAVQEPEPSRPTRTVVPLTPTYTPYPSPTPQPTYALNSKSLAQSVYTEKGYLRLLATTLIPAVVVVIGTVAVRLAILRRRRQV